MKQKTIFFPTLVLVSIVILSACAGLNASEEVVIDGEYGPQYTPQEHQRRTFDALWNIFGENYIYFKTADVDWEPIREEYNARIDSELTNEEFISLMRNLEGDLPTGALTYQSRAERIESDIEDFSTYEGIGAFIGFKAEEAPHIVVLDVIEGSPAEKAGIKPHDSIFEIDGSPVLLEEGIDVVNRVRGPAGSTVTLSVRTPGASERIIEVTRAELVSRGKLEARQLEDSAYGYILFPPISYEGLLEEFLVSMQTFTTNQQLEGLILDLRIASSSGGWPLEELLTLFHDGAVGDFYNSAQQKQSLVVEGQDVFGSQSVPLIILIGQNTSGFPEILAAALQEDERAIVIGETTPGAVENSTAYYLPDGSRVFIETTSFRLSNGEEIGLSGVQPQFEIEAGWDEVVPSNDPVLDKAVEILGTEK